MLICAALLSAACTGPPPPPEAPPLPEIRLGQFKGPVLAEAQSLLARLQATPEDAQLNGRLGMLLDAYQQLDSARTLYQRARAFDPGALGWNYLLGAVESVRGDFPAAIEPLEASLEIDPEFDPARRLLAEALMETSDLEGARAALESVLAGDPRDPRALVALGRLQARSGQGAEALGTFQRAVDAAPEYGAAHYELALALRDAGDLEESARHLALYEADPRAEPPSDDPLRAQVQSLRVDPVARLARAAELEQSGRMEEAAEQLRLALADDPSLAQAHVNLMILFGKAGNFDQAQSHYEAAVELGESGAELHYNYGVVQFLREDYAAAEKAFRRALEANPRHAGSLHNLAQMLEGAGRMAEAERRYRQALAARPGYRLAHFNLGRLLVGLGRTGEAVEQIKKSIEPRDERSPEFLQGLAGAYALGGNREAARRYALEAKQLALSYGQTVLAEALDRDLARLP